jgi:hypothetical protein
MRTSLVLSVSSLVLLVAGSASAQDASLPPGSGSVTLSAGFSPDPQTVAITAGGGIQATMPGCAGWIADAADYELTYTAGSFPLNIYFVGDGDTTLVINGPDGSWYCADDTNGVNPGVSFAAPMSGVYDIWVGGYAEGSFVPGTLSISEVAPSW